MTGLLYFVAALVLALPSPHLRGLRRQRRRAEARHLFFFSIIYLPC